MPRYGPWKLNPHARLRDKAFSDPPPGVASKLVDVVFANQERHDGRQADLWTWHNHGHERVILAYREVLP
jgi:hypothetical protein